MFYENFFSPEISISAPIWLIYFKQNRQSNDPSPHSFDIWIIVPFFNDGIHNPTSDFSKKSMKFLCYFKITRDYLYPLTRENLEQKGFYSFLNIVLKYVMIVSRRFFSRDILNSYIEKYSYKEIVYIDRLWDFSKNFYRWFLIWIWKSHLNNL